MGNDAMCDQTTGRMSHFCGNCQTNFKFYNIKFKIKNHTGLNCNQLLTIVGKNWLKRKLKQTKHG